MGVPYKMRAVDVPFEVQGNNYTLLLDVMIRDSQSYETTVHDLPGRLALLITHLKGSLMPKDRDYNCAPINGRSFYPTTSPYYNWVIQYSLEDVLPKRFSYYGDMIFSMVSYTSDGHREPMSMSEADLEHVTVEQ